MRIPLSIPHRSPTAPAPSLPEEGQPVVLPAPQEVSDVPDLVQRYRDRLLQTLDLAELLRLPEAGRRQRLAAAVAGLLQQDRLTLPDPDRAALVQQILDETVGLGPLEPLLRDPLVTEVMVVGPGQVYVEREGRICPAPVRFASRAHLLHIVQRAVAPCGRRIDESSPLVDARLPDGSRVHAVIPPVAVDGPYLTIRRFRPVPWRLADLVGAGALSAEMAAFLRQAVRCRLNILIAGGAGTGKTSLLAALAQEVPPAERLVIIEDSHELRLDRPHAVVLEGRPPNLEGRGEIPIRTLIRHALRMRPDRILVGEVRGEEAFDMVQAMNTGHRGSMCTLHANSAADALVRLEQMLLLAGTRVTVEAIRDYLAATVHLVVHLDRCPAGTRRVTTIAEVGRGPGGLQVRPLFQWYPGSGPSGGRFVPAGEPEALASQLSHVRRAAKGSEVPA